MITYACCGHCFLTFCFWHTEAASQFTRPDTNKHVGLCYEIQTEWPTHTSLLPLICAMRSRQKRGMMPASPSGPIILQQHLPQRSQLNWNSVLYDSYSTHLFIYYILRWLMINSNWHPISYPFGVIAGFSNFGHCIFEPPFGGLRDNIRCLSWARWKAHSRLPISVNWTFFAECCGWVATSKKISKIGNFAPTLSVWSKISGRRGRPSNNFCTVS